MIYTYSHIINLWLDQNQPLKAHAHVYKYNDMTTLNTFPYTIPSQTLLRVKKKKVTTTTAIYMYV